MTQDNKDLCETCIHYWQDFPLPLESVVSHCEILDSKKGLSANMDDEVPYPCLKCPFNSYIKNENYDTFNRQIRFSSGDREN